MTDKITRKTATQFSVCPECGRPIWAGETADFMEGIAHHSACLDAVLARDDVLELTTEREDLLEDFCTLNNNKLHRSEL